MIVGLLIVGVVVGTIVSLVEYNVSTARKKQRLAEDDYWLKVEMRKKHYCLYVGLEGSAKTTYGYPPTLEGGRRTSFENARDAAEAIADGKHLRIGTEFFPSHRITSIDIITDRFSGYDDVGLPPIPPPAWVNE